MVKISHLTVRYPDQTKAVDDLGFMLSKGETAALIGENGAGKTSLLLAVTGILESVSGTVEIGGVLLGKKNLQAVRRQTGLVFQNPDDQLFMPDLYEDIAFGCRNLGLPEEETLRRVEEAMERLHIGYLKDRSSLKLSGGEKRMAAIATVLAMQPSVLLFDEPTAFLDPRARRVLIGILTELPHTKLIATHDLAFAAEVCSRVIVMHKGRAAADGGIELLYHQKLMEEYGLEAIK